MRWMMAIAMLGIGVAGAIPAPAPAASKEEQQVELRKVSQEILQRLDKAAPSTRAKVQAASGYATFSNVGIKILVVGSRRAAELTAEGTKYYKDDKLN